MLFMAANCIEFAHPNTDSCTIDSTSGQPGDMAANEAIETPTTHVLTWRNTSYPNRFTSGTTQRLASMPAMAIGNSSNPEWNGE